jgi:ComF family protein
MRAAIHAFKYDRLHAVAPRLGRMLGEIIAQFAADVPDGMLVIPVPLHRSKAEQRGFNQARSLAEHALACLRKTHPAWRLTLAQKTLVRHRSTRSQAGLTPRQRRENVRGAFKISDPAAVAKRDILIVDDIFTTGATARSVSSVLMRAGAKSVRVATLARAHMVTSFARGASAYYDDGLEARDLTGNSPSKQVTSESIYSSSEQPFY